MQLDVLILCQKISDGCAPKKLRSGWKESAKQNYTEIPDELLISDELENDFDREEWEW